MEEDDTYDEHLAGPSVCGDGDSGGNGVRLRWERRKWKRERWRPDGSVCPAGDDCDRLSQFGIDDRLGGSDDHGQRIPARATVTIGGAPATNVTVSGDSSVAVTTPAHAAGAAELVVTNPDGRTARLQAGYTYMDYSGTWAGTTSRGDAVGFTVAAGRISNLRLTLLVSPCLVTMTSSESFPIEGNSFKFTMTAPGVSANFANTIPIAGTLSDGTTASGTWDSFVASTSCSNGSATTFVASALPAGRWTVTKR